MAFVRESVTQGLSQRAKAGIKVRQPLSRVVVRDEKGILSDAKGEYDSLITDELNVKKVEYSKDKAIDGAWVAIDTKFTDELRQEGLARELIRSIQSYRKKLDLKVDDRIELILLTSDKNMLEAIAANKANIMAETLSLRVSDKGTNTESMNTKVDGVDVKIGISKSDKL